MVVFRGLGGLDPDLLDEDGLDGTVGRAEAPAHVGGNGGDGIFTGRGSTVTGNTVATNQAYGLELDATLKTAYRDNVIDSNTAGTVSGGVNGGGNICNGNTTCP